MFMFLFPCSCCKAKKIVATLEEKQCKEGLLLSKRLRHCELAAQLYDRLATMPAHELHKCLQPLVSEGVDFPVSMKVKLILRASLEKMESGNLPEFLKVWSPWRMASNPEGDGDEDDFNPMQPCLKGLISSVADKELKLQMDMDEDSDGEDKPSKETNQGQLKLEWKAGLFKSKLHKLKNSKLQET